MGEVIDFPPQPGKQNKCWECGAEGPTFFVGQMSFHEILSATLETTYRCTCGAEVTVKFDAGFHKRKT